MRFAPPSDAAGKRGGCRIYYANIPDAGLILLGSIFGKGEKSDLTREEIAILREQARLFERLIRDQMEKSDE